MAEYLRSLERVMALSPVTMLPAHGPVIHEPMTLLREYVAHRHARERQVLAALGTSSLDVDAIVDRLYPNLSASLRSMATESVLAHLVKLKREGKVNRAESAWHIIDP